MAGESMEVINIHGGGSSGREVDRHTHAPIIMPIQEMKLPPIVIADPALRSSYGRHAPFALRTIVELVSTDGLTGISETYGGDGPLAGLEAARPHIVGSDPFQLTRLFQNVTSGASQSSGDRTQTYLVPG